MARFQSNGGAHRVHCSLVIARELQRLQEQANEEGRGEQVVRAIRHVWRRLQQDPVNFGEPLYRLPALRLQIRCGLVRPLAIDFGIHEDRPLVFIRGVQLLPKTGS